MQSLEFISQEKFAYQLPHIRTKNLLKLIEGINDRCQGNVDVGIVMDLQRKETKIWSELQRRGFIGKDKDNGDFNNWRKKLKYNKKLF